MPLRSFTAPDGARWQVWGVTPPGAAVTALQRRVRDRRSPDPVILYKGVERRRQERRRAAAKPVMETGWLVFESAQAKRRLAPPPEEWDTCPEPVLVELWNRATPVPVGFRLAM